MVEMSGFLKISTLCGPESELLIVRSAMLGDPLTVVKLRLQQVHASDPPVEKFVKQIGQQRAGCVLDFEDSGTVSTEERLNDSALTATEGRKRGCDADHEFIRTPPARSCGSGRTRQGAAIVGCRFSAQMSMVEVTQDTTVWSKLERHGVETEQLVPHSKNAHSTLVARE